MHHASSHAPAFSRSAAARLSALAAACVTALALTLLACTAPSARAADKVGFANRTLNGAYFNALTEYFKISAKAAGFDTVTTDAKADLNKQVADVEDMLSQGIKYLVLNPQDPVGGARIARIAQRRGVPVITVDSDIADDAPVLTRILGANFKNGSLVGEYAVSQFGNKEINAVIISGNQGNLVGEARRTGFMVGVIEAQLRNTNQTRFQVLTQMWGNWDQQGGLKAMEDALVSQGAKVNCLFTEMDDMTLGAIRALRASGKLKNVRVYSHDGYSKGLLAVKSGDIQATAINDPEVFAKMAVDVCKKLVGGNTDIPDVLYTPSILVTKDNVDKHYNPEALY
ncbi:ABC-type sugar transport system, periplasmic component [Opitutaceae bacterium TAV1]|nr:ABC-type sugar transport system, periplasmic component [Opitutaceae bacterium TAV1]